MPVAALCHGQTINIAGLARDAGVARTTVDGYIQILEDTLLVRRLPAYTTRLRVRERKHPKLYWIDPGVARAAKSAHGPLIPDERGALLEGWIHTLLVTYMAERDLAQKITYWSPAGSRQTEVDFLLSREAEHCALEIKTSSRVQSQHLAGLDAIAPLPGLRRRVLVHQGERPGRTEDGIELWPITKLLQALQTDSLWP